MAARLKTWQRLEGAQDEASSPAHHASLAASAGTGKTHVLTARVLRLLLRGAAPETILCLTFTKAGASEMAQRIHGRLARWVSPRLKRSALELDLQNLGEEPTTPLLERARSLFARVLEAPGGGLRVQTIHAFAQSLLGSFPNEAGLTPGFQPLDEREQQQLARTVLAEMLVRAEAGGDAPLIADVQALSLRFGEEAAEALLKACARAPDAMAALGPAQGIEPWLRDVFELDQGDIEDVIAAQCCDQMFDLASLKQAAQANAAWGGIKGTAHATRIGAWLERDPAARAASLEELTRVFVTESGSLRKSTTGLLRVAPNYDDHAARLADCCARLLQMRRTASWIEAAAAGLRAGQAFARAYAEAKRARGAVDFDDLIRETQKLLATPGMGDWVRYKLDQQIDHILIDEAQDTNAAQWRIVDALVDEFFAGEGRNRRHRTIFAVGDFKQAIFSFQGTDPAEFERARAYFAKRARDLRDSAREAFEAQGVLRGLIETSLPPDFRDLSMDRSFRSAPPVLAAVDAVVAELGSEALGLPRPPNRHVSHQAGLPGSVTLWRPFIATEGEPDEGEEGWLSDRVRTYARALARQVRAWLDRPFDVGAGKDRRPLRPEDILILVRRRGDLAGLIVARLHAERVPVAGIDRLTLSAPLAVQDLLAAARFAIQPLDDLNLAGLLVSPLLGWSQEQLYEAAYGRPGALWPHLREQAGRDLQPLYDMLGMADYATPHEYFERLLSGPLEGRRKLMERLGQEARDPIEELLSSALDFERQGAPSLARFLDWFSRGKVEITRDPSAPRDAVRVMTVHGAKGLEAPVVILADACADPGQPGGGGKLVDMPIDRDAGLAVPVPRPGRNQVGDPIAAIVADRDARDAREHWRLLYVAMTRARERLFVGGALGARATAPAEASWHAAVERGLASVGAEWVEDDKWGGALVLGDKGDPRLLNDDLEGSRSGEAQPGSPPALARGVGGGASSLPSWLHQPAPTEERPPRPLAPSSIGADEASYPPPTPELRREALRGKLLHRLFERLPDVPGPERHERAEAWLARSGDAPDPAFRAALIADACRVIDDPRFAALFSPAALAEAPIAATVGGQVIAGTADRLLVEQDRVLVADFKTGRRVPAGAEGAPPSHLRQMAAYRAALAIIFPGRRIEAALLYTAGPALLALPDALLDAHAPALA